MPDGFQFLDIIFFAMLAAFIALRLRSVLGRRTGDEPTQPRSLSPPQTEESGDNVVRLADRDPVATHVTDDFSDIEDPELAAGLRAILSANSQFSLSAFLQGANTAFELIVASYSAGDTKRLRELVDDTVFELFSAAINERETSGEKLETTLVEIQDNEIIEAEIDDDIARITVRFTSDQINLMRGADGGLIDGDPSESHEVVDFWTFGRDSRSRDPNWKLVATRGRD